MLNTCSIVGRLGREPELKGSGDKQVCTFTVATDRRNDEVDWHRVVVFGKSAENCSKYLNKGSIVAIDGRIQYGSYEKDGNKFHTADIIANRVSFVGGPAKAEGEEFA